MGFYARFIPNFSHRAAPLHALKRKGAKFVWEKEQQAAFDSLKQALCEAPVLQIPDFSREFVLATDASDLAVSAVLQQRIGDALMPISYCSRLLTPPLSANTRPMRKSVLPCFLDARNVGLIWSTRSLSSGAIICPCAGC